MNRAQEFVREIRGTDSLRAFAAKLGVSHMTISNWESGNTALSLADLSKTLDFDAIVESGVAGDVVDLVMIVSDSEMTELDRLTREMISRLE